MDQCTFIMETIKYLEQIFMHFSIGVECYPVSFQCLKYHAVPHIFRPEVLLIWHILFVTVNLLAYLAM